MTIRHVTNKCRSMKRNDAMSAQSVEGNGSQNNHVIGVRGKRCEGKLFGFTKLLHHLDVPGWSAPVVFVVEREPWDECLQQLFDMPLSTRTCQCSVVTCRGRRVLRVE